MTEENTRKLPVNIRFAIPYRSLWSVAGLIVWSGLGYLYFVQFIIPTWEKFLSMLPPNGSGGKMDTIIQVAFMFADFLAIMFFSVAVALMANIFKKLKNHKSPGLLDELVTGGLLFLLFFILIPLAVDSDGTLPLILMICSGVYVPYLCIWGLRKEFK